MFSEVHLFSLLVIGLWEPNVVFLWLHLNSFNMILLTVELYYQRQNIQF